MQNCINKNLETPERGCSVQPHFRSLRNYSSTLSCSTLDALGGLCLAQAARLSIPQVCFPVFFTKHFLSLSAGSSSLSNYSIHPPSYGQLLAPSQVHGSQSVPTLCHSLCLQNILIYVTFLTRTGFENSFLQRCTKPIPVWMLEILCGPRKVTIQVASLLATTER